MDVEVKVVPQGQELILREGNAPDVEVKQPVALAGTVESVIDFAKKRVSRMEKLDTHVILNEDAGELTLVVGEQDRIRHTVTGKMIPHPYISEMGINQNKSYSIAMLIKLFKLNRRFFSTREQHAELITALKNFQATTEIEFKDANDYKGNVAEVKISKVKHNIPLAFTMTIAVFKGQQKQIIPVEIEVYPENGSLCCGLVSVELAEAIEDIKAAVFAGVRKELEVYVQIEK